MRVFGVIAAVVIAIVVAIGVVAYQNDSWIFDDTQEVASTGSGEETTTVTPGGQASNTNGATSSASANGNGNGDCEASSPKNITSQVMTVSRANSPEGKSLPDLTAPDPNRQTKFPNVPEGNRPALVEYGHPWEDGDFHEDCFGDFDVSQFHFRVLTAGVIDVPQLDVSCESTDTKGCALVVINWFGKTVMYRDTRADNGFTLAGRVWDMKKPNQATLAAQALLDHYMGRMVGSPDGANCGVIDACESVEWHVVIVGDNLSDGSHEIQAHWAGLYSR